MKSVSENEADNSKYPLDPEECVKDKLGNEFH